MRITVFVLLVLHILVGCARVHDGDAVADAGGSDGRTDSAPSEASVADAVVDSDAAAFACTQLGEVGTATRSIDEPGISVDGQKLFANTTSGAYVSVRLGSAGVWTSWRATDALPAWAQDPSFVELEGTEHVFVARTDVPGAPTLKRSLWVCVGPFADGVTPSCQQIVVTELGADTPIEVDADGPSLATIDGELRMTLNYRPNNINRVLIARPAVAGLIVSWRGERLQGGALDADDVVMSDDGAVIVTTLKGINIWRRGGDGRYTLAHTTKPTALAEDSGAELYKRPDGSLEIFYAERVTYMGKSQRRVFSMLCQR